MATAKLQNNKNKGIQAKEYINKVRNAEQDKCDTGLASSLQAQCAAASQVGEYNQVDTLHQEIDRLQYIIKEQEKELLALYRRTNGIY